MKIAFLIKNQHNHYLTRDGQWLAWRERVHFKRLASHDEALNTLIEANTKDIDLRLHTIAIEVNIKGKIIDDSEPSS